MVRLCARPAHVGRARGGSRRGRELFRRGRAAAAARWAPPDRERRVPALGRLQPVELAAGHRRGASSGPGMITSRKVHGELTINIGFAIVKLAALVVVIRLAGVAFAPEALGVFLLARRLASTVANLLQLGASQTLLRYLPMTRSPGARHRYVTVACALWLGVAVIALATWVPLRSIVAAWAFPGVPAAEELAAWAAALATVTILEFIVCTSFLAERRLVPANTLDLMSVSGSLLLRLAWPIGALTPTSLLRYQALGVLSMCLAAMAIRLWNARRASSEAQTIPTWTETARAFATYGLPRGGITGLDVAILTIGPWLLREQPAQAGY